MTQKIIHTYVSFEQAKWLKEKGFKGRSRYYGGSGELVEVPNIIESGNYRHTNNEMQRFRWEAPEQHQVVEWLRVNHGIWICVNKSKDAEDNGWFHYYVDNKWSAKLYDTPQEAYSAAFDYVLNNLI
jgi:hypothetical protein